MMRRLYAPILVAGLSLASLQAAAATGADGPTAESWAANCAVFMNVMTGQGQGSDAELSYCVGQTEGILSALRTGAQIGAIAFAGILTREAGMNEQAVFQLFQRTGADALLGVCMPAGTQTASQIQAIYRHYQRNPGKKSLPAPALFYDALQETYPCAPTAPPAQAKPR